MKFNARLTEEDIRDAIGCYVMKKHAGVIVSSVTLHVDQADRPGSGSVVTASADYELHAAAQGSDS
jgi:hypothetical protein